MIFISEAFINIFSIDYRRYKNYFSFFELIQDNMELIFSAFYHRFLLVLINKRFHIN